MSARRFCDNCGRIRVWTLDNSVAGGVRCLSCGTVERTEGLDYIRVAQGTAAEFPHQVGCTELKLKDRVDPDQPSLIITQCPRCDAKTWRKNQ